ncbi:hypothetical protein KQX54_021478 [Cotesia glomerata]|uniref:Uncharacterized protein n=1 Tax=Cotesia glomerata TaxID=32391 RepID=A0AAV7J7I0_COTGL|nr:hypothetical protein KQX54_021478 [Cotesia glomerata]
MPSSFVESHDERWSERKKPGCFLTGFEPRERVLKNEENTPAGTIMAVGLVGSFSSLLFCSSISSETLSLEYYCRRALRTQQKSSALPNVPGEKDKTTSSVSASLHKQLGSEVYIVWKRVRQEENPPECISKEGSHWSCAEKEVSGALRRVSSAQSLIEYHHSRDETGYKGYIMEPELEPDPENLIRGRSRSLLENTLRCSDAHAKASPPKYVSSSYDI